MYVFPHFLVREEHSYTYDDQVEFVTVVFLLLPNMLTY